MFVKKKLYYSVPQSSNILEDRLDIRSGILRKSFSLPAYVMLSVHPVLL